MAGKNDSPSAFRDLISQILHLTVLKQNEVIRLWEFPKPDFFIVGGALAATDPIRLNNNHYLRLTMTLRHDKRKHRLMIEQASYQYQMEREDNHRWIFRYDYLLNQSPDSQYPPCHLQLNAKFPADVGLHRDMHKIHFPVNAISLEAVIRLLAEEFHVPCNKPATVWRHVLTESDILRHQE